MSEVAEHLASIIQRATNAQMPALRLSVGFVLKDALGL